MAAERRAPACELPTVSVLLPAWNEAAMLGRCLDSLLAIDWPGLEIVVCAGGSDGTLEIARSYAGPRVTVLEQRPGEGKQVALRRCFAASHGEIIYLTDADCVVPEAAFHAVVAPLVDGEADAATGLSLPLPEQREIPLIIYQWGKDLAGTRRHGEFAHGVHGRNAAVRRDVLERLAPFDAPVPSGTDYHLSQQLRVAQVRVRWAPGFVLSEFPASAGDYVRMWRRWIKNVLVQGTRTRSWSEVRTTGVGVASSFALLGTPFLGLLFGRRVLAPWLLLFATVTMRRYREHGVPEHAGEVPKVPQAALRFPAFVMLDAASAVAGLIAALVPRLRSTW